MIPVLDTRKPVDSLTAADFDTFAVWEFAEDEEGVEGRDETWVRPSPSQVLSGRASPYAVRAELTTPDGKRLLGVVWVRTWDGLEVEALALFPDGAYAYVGKHSLEFAETNRQHLAGLGIEFPLAFDLSVELDGQAVNAAGLFA